MIRMPFQADRVLALLEEAPPVRSNIRSQNRNIWRACCCPAPGVTRHRISRPVFCVLRHASEDKKRGDVRRRGPVKKQRGKAKIPQRDEKSIDAEGPTEKQFRPERG